MPDDKGKLSEKEVATVGQRFHDLETKRGGDLECEMCSCTVWGISPGLVGLVSDIRNPMWEHIRLPSVAFVCRDCGNTKFFNAESMGIKIWKLDEEGEE